MGDDMEGCCSIRLVVALLVLGRDQGGEQVLDTEARSARLWVSNRISYLQARIWVPGGMIGDGGRECYHQPCQDRSGELAQGQDVKARRLW